MRIGLTLFPVPVLIHRARRLTTSMIALLAVAECTIIARTVTKAFRQSARAGFLLRFTQEHPVAVHKNPWPVPL